MTSPVKIIVLLLLFCFKNAYANEEVNEQSKPNDFIEITQVIPEIQKDIRYFSENNFMGKRVSGYAAASCFLTLSAANALKKVEDRLLPMGLTLKVYDCYRPQQAVNEFISWADDDDEKTKEQFYPGLDKSDLFKEGYIAKKSGHSRGSTVDLTIAPVGSHLPVFDKDDKRTACTLPLKVRRSDNSLDFGTSFDCFSPVSHPNYQDLPAQIKANRLLLKILMEDAGFKSLETEWWHFTLRDEPYPNTWFNFLVQ